MSDPRKHLASETPWQVVEAYHEAAKHYFHRYARSAGRLDWANQPEAFRRFDAEDLWREQ